MALSLVAVPSHEPTTGASGHSPIVSCDGLSLLYLLRIGIQVVFIWAVTILVWSAKKVPELALERGNNITCAYLSIHVGLPVMFVLPQSRAIAHKIDRTNPHHESVPALFCPTYKIQPYDIAGRNNQWYML